MLSLAHSKALTRGLTCSHSHTQSLARSYAVAFTLSCAFAPFNHCDVLTHTRTLAHSAARTLACHETRSLLLIHSLPGTRSLNPTESRLHPHSACAGCRVAGPRVRTQSVVLVF
eukprot:6198506-Pleurochrysis_carterae.AAC.1